MKSNLVHALEYVQLKNLPPEPQSWASRARAQVMVFLSKINEHIAQKGMQKIHP